MGNCGLMTYPYAWIILIVELLHDVTNLIRREIEVSHGIKPFRKDSHKVKDPSSIKLRLDRVDLHPYPFNPLLHTPVSRLPKDSSILTPSVGKGLVWKLRSYDYVVLSSFEDF